jgi:hypothetical protein
VQCAAAEAVTPYLHTTVCAISEQVKLGFDVLKLSGQGLENLNQWRKRHGKSNGKDGQIMQLSKQEQSRIHVAASSGVKPPPHQRSKEISKNKMLHSLTEANAH